jgi:hypothetical protein
MIETLDAKLPGFSIHNLFFPLLNIYYKNEKIVKLFIFVKIMGRKKIYTFKLSGIDRQKVHETYIRKSLITEKEDDLENTTKLSELVANCKKDIVSFLDESKNEHTCKVSMIDFSSKKNVNLLRYHCFWCKNPFNSKPIGCPLKYVPGQLTKKYFSHISKEYYTITENVTKNNRKELENNGEFLCSTEEYYQTDGVFCSFNCCQSFIHDNKHKRIYDNSSLLLLKMYNEIMRENQKEITPAPHWRTLEHYGGHLNIMKFREGFGRVEYECHGGKD